MNLYIKSKNVIITNQTINTMSKTKLTIDLPSIKNLLDKAISKGSTNINTIPIKLSNDYIFNLFFVKDEEILKKELNTKMEYVFNVNISTIVNTIKKIKEFSNLVYSFGFRENLKSEEKLIAKKNCHKIDAIIRIENSADDVEMCVEYNEYNSHSKMTKNRSEDSFKESHISQFCHYYEQYHEQETPEVSYFIEFYTDLIFTIFQYSCSILENKSTLAKILYFKNYVGKNIKIDTTKFNNLLKYHAMQNIKLQYIYEEFNPIDLETDEQFDSIESFKKYLVDNHGINVDKKNMISFSNFGKMIVNLDANISSQLQTYKKIYASFMDSIIEASDVIISLCKRNDKQIKQRPQFVKNVITHYLFNLSDEFLVETAVKSATADNKQLINTIIPYLTKCKPTTRFRVSEHLKKLAKYDNINTEDSSDEQYSEQENMSELEEEIELYEIEKPPTKKKSQLDTLLQKSKNCKICL